MPFTNKILKKLGNCTIFFKTTLTVFKRNINRRMYFTVKMPSHTEIFFDLTARRFS